MLQLLAQMSRTGRPVTTLFKTMLTEPLSTARSLESALSPGPHFMQHYTVGHRELVGKAVDVKVKEEKTIAVVTPRKWLELDLDGTGESTYTTSLWLGGHNIGVTKSLCPPGGFPSWLSDWRDCDPNGLSLGPQCRYPTFLEPSRPECSMMFRALGLGTSARGLLL